MRVKKAALVLGAFAALAGCSGAEGQATMAALSSFDLFDYFQGDVNLAEKNYAAADYLADRGKGFVKKEDGIKALPLLDEDEPRMETKFGRRIPEQIGERLNELGYNVDITGVATGVDPAFQATQQTVMSNPRYLLTGSYARKTSQINIRLRMQDAVTGQVRAMYDYALPRHGNVRKDSKAEPMIMKVDDQPAQVEEMEIQPVPEDRMHGNK